MAKSLEALKLNVRERVEVRLTTGSRWSLAGALRERARRRQQQSFYAIAALTGGIVVAAAFAMTTGLV